MKILIIYIFMKRAVLRCSEQRWTVCEWIPQVFYKYNAFQDPVKSFRPLSFRTFDTIPLPTASIKIIFMPYFQRSPKLLNLTPPNLAIQMFSELGSSCSCVLLLQLSSAFAFWKIHWTLLQFFKLFTILSWPKYFKLRFQPDLNLSLSRSLFIFEFLIF